MSYGQENRDTTLSLTGCRSLCLIIGSVNMAGADVYQHWYWPMPGNQCDSVPIISPADCEIIETWPCNRSVLLVKHLLVISPGYNSWRDQSLPPRSAALSIVDPMPDRVCDLLPEFLKCQCLPIPISQFNDNGNPVRNWNRLKKEVSNQSGPARSCFP